MSDEKPVVYILHGDDPYGIEREIDNLRDRMGDPVTAEMNTTFLDGRSCSLGDLVNAAGAMPFLAERRLVILNHPLTRLAAEKAKEPFLSLLNGLQSTSALVLVIEDTYQGKRKGWASLKEKHWLRQWADQAGGRAYLKTYTLPKPYEMPNWIIQRAVELGGRFNRDAANTLAAQVGSDTRFATQEIIKLLTYVNYDRMVEKEDVLELTPSGMQTNVFELVDKMSTGEVSGASRVLHALLEEEDAQGLFAMVIRQFRLLLQTRDLLDEGFAANTIPAEVGVPPFVAEKLISQANRFSLAELENIYRYLYQLDKAIKTGKISCDLALDTLIASLKRS